MDNHTQSVSRAFLIVSLRTWRALIDASLLLLEARTREADDSAYRLLREIADTAVIGSHWWRRNINPSGGPPV
jgi:hypothetical protein